MPSSFGGARMGLNKNVSERYNRYRGQAAVRQKVFRQSEKGEINMRYQLFKNRLILSLLLVASCFANSLSAMRLSRCSGFLKPVEDCISHSIKTDNFITFCPEHRCLLNDAELQKIVDIIDHNGCASSIFRRDAKGKSYEFHRHTKLQNKNNAYFIKNGILNKLIKYISNYDGPFLDSVVLRVIDQIPKEHLNKVA
jgi:hypothetical protein